MIHLLCLLVFLTLGLTAKAQESIVLGLSQDEVAITASFTGSEILIFGAIRRETPAPANSELGVIIAVAGPNAPAAVRRKERVAGLWVNSETVNMDIAPSFYAVATSAPLDEVLLPLENYQHAVSADRIVRAEGQTAFDSNEFTEAFIRLKERNRLFQVIENAVIIDQDTLFHTSISLPSNLTEGNYRTRIFLTRNGQVVDHFDTIIPVFKVGIERWLYNLSQSYAALYGLLSLVIAVVAGWAANAAFAALRR